MTDQFDPCNPHHAHEKAALEERAKRERAGGKDEKFRRALRHEPAHLSRSAFSTLRSGIGKTNFAIRLGMATVLGRDFLHWPAGRSARTLYLDGEMSRSLFKRRIEDAARRAGAPIDAPFFGFCRDDLPEMPPLNTEAGQNFVDALLDRIGGIDFIIFDNVQSLLIGDMKEEQPWQETLPRIRMLTARRVGQMWIHHTGHDESRSYGTKTREWQLDCVVVLEPDKASPHDIAFELKFTKARQRTPENRADFAPAKITLVNDVWAAEVNGQKAKTGSARVPSPLAKKFYAALNDATVTFGKPRPQTAGRSAVTKAEWEVECVRLGLIDPEADDSKRALMSKYRRELIASDWIACNGDFIWPTKLLKE